MKLVLVTHASPITTPGKLSDAGIHRGKMKKRVAHLRQGKRSTCNNTR